MNIEDARTHYRTIQTVLKAERTMRMRVLAEPRKSAAVKEIDQALAALQELGKVIQAAAAAGLLESLPEQAPLLDLPNLSQYR